jgi:hypothetical protein
MRILFAVLVSMSGLFGAESERGQDLAVGQAADSQKTSSPEATGPTRQEVKTVLHPFEPERHYGIKVTPEQAKVIEQTDARSDVIRKGQQIGVSQPYTLPGECAKGG